MLAILLPEKAMPLRHLLRNGSGAHRITDPTHPPRPAYSPIWFVQMRISTLCGKSVKRVRSRPDYEWWLCG